MRLLLVFVFAFLADIAVAQADWLEEAWSGKSTAVRGNPAITVHPDGVSVVLPAETLDEAFSERGMTRPDALREFLDRYSPQCSTVLDLNTAQPNLAVELRIQAPMSLDDLATDSLDEMFAAMETVTVAPSTGTSSKDAGSRGTGKGGHTQVPRIAQVFTTLPERFDFSIDYAPDKIVHCIVPQDSIS
jgi:hypothetical protein